MQEGQRLQVTQQIPSDVNSGGRMTFRVPEPVRRVSSSSSSNNSGNVGFVNTNVIARQETAMGKDKCVGASGTFATKQQKVAMNTHQEKDVNLRQLEDQNNAKESESGGTVVIGAGKNMNVIQKENLRGAATGVDVDGTKEHRQEQGKIEGPKRERKRENEKINELTQHSSTSTLTLMAQPPLDINITNKEKTVTVDCVLPNSLLYGKVFPGDIITHVDDIAVSNVRSFARMMAGTGESGRKLTIKIRGQSSAMSGKDGTCDIMYNGGDGDQNQEDQQKPTAKAQHEFGGESVSDEAHNFKSWTERTIRVTPPMNLLIDNSRQNYIRVVEVFAESPLYGRIYSGDILTHIDGKAVTQVERVRPLIQNNVSCTITVRSTIKHASQSPGPQPPTTNKTTTTLGANVCNQSTNMVTQDEFDRSKNIQGGDKASNIAQHNTSGDKEDTVETTLDKDGSGPSCSTDNAPSAPVRKPLHEDPCSMSPESFVDRSAHRRESSSEGEVEKNAGLRNKDGLDVQIGNDSSRTCSSTNIKPSTPSNIVSKDIRVDQKKNNTTRVLHHKAKFTGSEYREIKVSRPIGIDINHAQKDGFPIKAIFPGCKISDKISIGQFITHVNGKRVSKNMTPGDFMKMSGSKGSECILTIQDAACQIDKPNSVEDDINQIVDEDLDSTETDTGGKSKIKDNYSVSKTSGVASGRWTEDEKKQFLIGLEHHGPGKWSAIASDIPTRDTIQVKSHGHTILKQTRRGEDAFQLSKGSVGIRSPNAQALASVNFDEAKFPFLDQFNGRGSDADTDAIASTIFETGSEGSECNLTFQSHATCQIDQSKNACRKGSEDSDGSPLLFSGNSKEGPNQIAQNFLKMRDARMKKKNEIKKKKQKKMAFDASMYTDKDLEAAVEKSKMICKIAEEREKAFVDEIAARIFSSDDEEEDETIHAWRECSEDPPKVSPNAEVAKASVSDIINKSQCHYCLKWMTPEGLKYHIENRVCRKDLNEAVVDSTPILPVQKVIYKDDDDFPASSSESDDDSLFETAADVEEIVCRNCLTKFGNAELLASHLLDEPFCQEVHKELEIIFFEQSSQESRKRAHGHTDESTEGGSNSTSNKRKKMIHIQQSCDTSNQNHA